MKTRSEFIDFAKGIAIFLVVWGHVIQYISWTPVTRYDFFSDNVFKIIYSFHMPLFMILSGYLFYWSSLKKSPKKLIESRLKSLFIPMLVWGGIGTLLNMIGQGTDFSLLHIMKNLVVETISIWFLWAVLISAILIALINGYCSEKSRVYAYLLAYVFVFFLPSGEMVAFMFPYFVCGYLYNANKGRLPMLNPVSGGVVVFIFIILLSNYDVQHYIYNSGLNPFVSEEGFGEQISIDTYRYMIGLFGSIAVLWMLYRFFLRFSSSKGAKYIARIGKVSLQIYLMQRVVLERVTSTLWVKLCQKVGGNIFMEVPLVFDVVISPILSLVVVVVILYCLKMLGCHSRINNILFGR